MKGQLKSFKKYIPTNSIVWDDEKFAASNKLQAFLGMCISYTRSKHYNELGYFFATNEDFMEALNASKPTVISYANYLIEKGWISKKSGGRGTANEYSVLVDLTKKNGAKVGKILPSIVGKKCTIKTIDNQEEINKKDGKNFTHNFTLENESNLTNEVDGDSEVGKILPCKTLDYQEESNEKDGKICSVESGLKNESNFTPYIYTSIISKSNNNNNNILNIIDSSSIEEEESYNNITYTIDSGNLCRSETNQNFEDMKTENLEKFSKVDLGEVNLTLEEIIEALGVQERLDAFTTWSECKEYSLQLKQQVEKSYSQQAEEVLSKAKELFTLKRLNLQLNQTQPMVDEILQMKLQLEEKNTPSKKVAWQDRTKPCPIKDYQGEEALGLGKKELEFCKHLYFRGVEGYWQDRLNDCLSDDQAAQVIDAIIQRVLEFGCTSWKGTMLKYLSLVWKNIKEEKMKLEASN